MSKRAHNFCAGPAALPTAVLQRAQAEMLDWQGKGLARRLMATLIDTARAAGLRYMHGDFLSEITRMLAFVASPGFVLSAHPEDPGLKRGVLVLN